MDIFCVGLMVCDILVKPVDSGVFIEDSRIVDQMNIAVGGDAINASINMSRMGLDVALCGCVGNDALGHFLIDEAKKSGVNTDGVKLLKNTTTSTSLVLIEEQGERHFIYYGHANNLLTAADVDWNAAQQAKILHVGSAMALAGLDYEGLFLLFRNARARHIKTSLDVTWDNSGQWMEKIKKALPYTDYFMPSFQEAVLVSGKDTYEEIASFFKGAGVGTLVIKDGSKGCFITDFKESHFVAACKNVIVKDTTGAGDAFVSGFLTGKLKGWSLSECGKFANTLGAMCVSEIGAVTGVKDFVGAVNLMKTKYH